MLILASNSPRRKQLLSLGGWDFLVIPAEIDETPLPGEDPAAYVLRLAEEKGRQVGRRIAATQPAALRIAKEHGEDREPELPELVIAADTTVALDGSILGKPADVAEAAEMLWQLRGRTHQVYSALSVLRLADGAMRSDVCATAVQMRPYTRQEMDAYIASGDPFDKAGAYAIQHSSFHPVEALQGCYTNVMGLPLCRLAYLLSQFGAPPATDIPRAMRRELGYTCPIYDQVLRGAPCGETAFLPNR